MIIKSEPITWMSHNCAKLILYDISSYCKRDTLSLQLIKPVVDRGEQLFAQLESYYKLTKNLTSGIIVNAADLM